MKSYLSKSFAKPILYGALALSLAYSCKQQDAKNQDCPENCISITNSENVTITHNHYTHKKGSVKKIRNNKTKISPTQKIAKEVVKDIISIDTIAQEPNNSLVPNTEYNYDYYGSHNDVMYKPNCFKEAREQ